MGFDSWEWRWSTERSSWFGHQSLFVLGLPVLGVGAGIAGFSLSLTLRVWSLSGMRPSPLRYGWRSPAELIAHPPRAATWTRTARHTASSGSALALSRACLPSARAPWPRTPLFVIVAL